MSERCARCDAYGYHEPWCSSMLGEPEREERGVFTHDFREEAQIMCADNARLCRIIEAADRLAEAVVAHGERHFAIREALDNYKIVRQGQ